MKKLVLFFAAAIFAVSFAACGNKAAKTEEAPVADEVVVVDEVAEDAPVEVAEEVAAE